MLEHLADSTQQYRDWEWHALCYWQSPFQVQMHAIVTQEDHFFKLCLQDLMFCVESQVLVMANALWMTS